MHHLGIVFQYCGNNSFTTETFVILLFVHLERTRLGPAGYARFSAGDRQEGGPARSTIGGGMMQVPWAGIIPLFLNWSLQKVFQNICRLGKGGTMFQAESSVKSQILHGAFSSSALQRVGWPVDWRGTQAMEDSLCLVRDCRLDPVSKEEPLEDFTKGSFSFGVSTPFFFFLSNRLYFLKKF